MRFQTLEKRCETGNWIGTRTNPRMEHRESTQVAEFVSGGDSHPSRRYSRSFEDAITVRDRLNCYPVDRAVAMHAYQ